MSDTTPKAVQTPEITLGDALGPRSFSAMRDAIVAAPPHLIPDGADLTQNPVTKFHLNAVVAEARKFIESMGGSAIYSGKEAVGWSVPALQAKLDETPAALPRLASTESLGIKKAA